MIFECFSDSWKDGEEIGMVNCNFVVLYDIFMVKNVFYGVIDIYLKFCFKCDCFIMFL